MPSKRGISKKFNPAKCFTSPRKIDKKSRRHKYVAKRRQHDRFFHRDIRHLEDRKTTQHHNRVALRKQKLTSKAKKIVSENEVVGSNHFCENKQSKLSLLPPKKRDHLEQKRDHLEQKRQHKRLSEQHSVSDGQQQPKAQPQQQPSVSQEQKQEVRVFALGQFNQLLQVVAPNSLVVLDIDETLIITENVPSLLLDQPGVLGFQKYITEKFPDFESRNHHCRRLQKILMNKALVEKDTAAVIQELQRRNCRVFALTARYVQLAERTHRVLESLGISFEDSAPFPAHPIQDPVTKAVVMKGIVYCNGADKGAILSRLLSSVILPREQKEAHKNKHGGAFAGIHFVDDRLEHTLSVRDALQSFRGLNVPSLCFHYRSPPYLLGEAQKHMASTHPKLLPFIMDYFVSHGQVLSNTEALQLMNSKMQ